MFLDITLSTVDGLQSGQVLYVVPNAPLPPINPQRSSTADNRSNRRLQPYRVNRAQTRLYNCDVLHKNIVACINASATAMNPVERTRFNEPAEPTPTDPTAIDFGNHVMKFATAMRDWAVELNKMSDLLIRDPELTGSDQEYARRLIQNNIDTARYTQPYLQNFTKFCIPLNFQGTRQLMVTDGNSRGPRIF